jgi:8-oxo-dGTP diphosphatase
MPINLRSNKEDLKYCYKYPRVALTVDAIVIARDFNQEMILLILRKFEPFVGLWALPGGFIGMEETLRDACLRELHEETGLKELPLEQFYTFDAIGRDPRHRTISTVFWGRIREVVPVTGGDDATKAEWFPISTLPEMAFDHALIIQKFVKEKL